MFCVGFAFQTQFESSKYPRFTLFLLYFYLLGVEAQGRSYPRCQQIEYVQNMSQRKITYRVSGFISVRFHPRKNSWIFTAVFLSRFLIPVRRSAWRARWVVRLVPRMEHFSSYTEDEQKLKGKGQRRRLKGPQSNLWSAVSCGLLYSIWLSSDLIRLSDKVPLFLKQLG